MTRLLRFFVLIVAIAALSAPSASLGMGVTGPVWTLSDASVHVPVLSCKSLGGKRVLPCHPDLGVMGAMANVAMPAIGPLPALRVGLPLIAVTPEAELPPPRQA